MSTKTIQLRYFASIREAIGTGSEAFVTDATNVGALRGTSLGSVMMMDVEAIQKVLPRCTEPPLIQAEIDQLDPADLVQLGTAVSGFLLTKKLRAQLPDA